MTSEFFNPEKRIINHNPSPMTNVYTKYCKTNFILDFHWEMSKAQVHSPVSKENETGERNWKHWSSTATMTWKKDMKNAVLFLSIFNASQDFSF